MIIVIISALKRKILFFLRLCLLMIILSILVTQIYGVFTEGLPETDQVTAEMVGSSGFLENTLNWLKQYYRGDLR